ncbi:MAG: putative phosphohydrolase [Acidimicrobiales bacterium]|nr:putative phosphohydrolase [Acidimicrobiales bacterium]
MSDPVGPARAVDEVLALYAQWGVDPYDEELSQLDHALQTAALAATAHADDALVAAALLHDVGHLLELDIRGPGRPRPDADLGHEGTGARHLAALFPPAVTGPIALHVRAKRYRCAVDPAYLAQLSDGSRRSLALQGGPMAATEIAVFEAHPGFTGAVALRGWDDEGKVDGLAVPPVEHYRPLLDRIALTAADAPTTRP